MKRFILLLTVLFVFLSSLPVCAVSDPGLSHSAASLVYCTEPDRVLYSSEADKKVYPAALTKLMTVVLAAESIESGKTDADQLITASASAISAVEGNHISIMIGEKLKFRDLVGATILAGANDAALVIAEAVSGSVPEFVRQMNRRADQLGMKDTVYTNPTGLHDGEMVTTANDLLILAKLAATKQFLSELFGSIRITIDATNMSGARSLGTRNYLVSTRVTTDYYLPMATGMICGSTYEAGFCVIASAQHDGLNYIAILLGADTTRVQSAPAVTDETGSVVTPAEYKYIMNGFVEAAKLLKWADGNFSYIKAVDGSTPVCQIPVRLADGIDNVALLPEHPVEIFVPNDIDRENDIKLEWTLDSGTLTAPVQAGQEVGMLRVTYMGEFIGEVPLVVRTGITADGGLTVLDRVGQLMRTPFFTAILIAVAVCALIYVFGTAISRSRKKNEAKREFVKKNRYRSLPGGDSPDNGGRRLK